MARLRPARDRLLGTIGHCAARPPVCQTATVQSALLQRGWAGAGQTVCILRRVGLSERRPTQSGTMAFGDALRSACFPPVKRRDRRNAPTRAPWQQHRARALGRGGRGEGERARGAQRRWDALVARCWRRPHARALRLSLVLSRLCGFPPSNVQPGRPHAHASLILHLHLRPPPTKPPPCSQANGLFRLRLLCLCSPRPLNTQSVQPLCSSAPVTPFRSLLLSPLPARALFLTLCFGWRRAKAARLLRSACARLAAAAAPPKREAGQSIPACARCPRPLVLLYHVECPFDAAHSCPMSPSPSAVQDASRVWCSCVVARPYVCSARRSLPLASVCDQRVRL